MLRSIVLALLLVCVCGQQIPWLAFNGGGSRTGINNNETIITVGTVGSLKQQWMFNLTQNASDPIDSSLVFWPSVSLPSGVVADLLFANSLFGTLYAVNAANGAIVWQNTVTVACKTDDCITKSTPAIDPSGKYVYCYRVDGTVRRYAIGTGVEVTGSGFPVFTTYIPTYEEGSSPLNIVGNLLYITVSGDNHDDSWYVGHVIAVDLATGTTNVWNALCSNLRYVLQQPDCRVDDRNGAGIWSRGSAVASPEDGSIYVATGNGLFNANVGGYYYADSIIRLRPGLPNQTASIVMDSYTPADYVNMQDQDYDLGSSSPVMLPPIPASKTPLMLVQASKDYKLRLINREDMSGQGCCGHVGGEVHQVNYTDGFVLTAPLAWQDPADGQVWVFVVSTNDEQPAAGFHAYQILTDAAGASTLHLNYTIADAGTSPFVAADVLYVQILGAIRALDPRTGKILWTSTPAMASDAGLHWQSPIVVNGHVFAVDNSGGMYAYGL